MEELQRQTELFLKELAQEFSNEWQNATAGVAKISWQLINHRQQATEQGRIDETKLLSDEIKQNAAKDKKDALMNSLIHLEDQKEK